MELLILKIIEFEMFVLIILNLSNLFIYFKSFNKIILELFFIILILINKLFK